VPTTERATWCSTPTAASAARRLLPEAKKKFHAATASKDGELAIDIDYFKRVNDSFGHGVGDDVIEFVGRTIQAQVRTTDKVARFGGEEFVVLLRETDVSNGTMLAERIREQIARSLIAVRGDSAVHVTVSIGLATAKEDDRDIADVIERGDRALYVAKSSGRNRVVADEVTATSKAA
jgi:diguanylate cyclase (GGDEF)-like protein